MWAPPPTLADRLGALLYGETELIGGGDLCAAASYYLHDNRDWLGELLETEAAGLGQWVEQLTARTHESFRRGLVPIMRLKTGDEISLQLAPSDGPSKVVYVDQVGKALLPISPSFDAFLMAWEEMSYIEPKLDNLRHWRDPVTGMLDTDNARARALQQLLIEASHRGALGLKEQNP